MQLNASSSMTMRHDPKPEERRRHRRVKVVLLGRYMLADQNEYSCRTVDMSPGGVLLNAPVRGNPSERVVAYLEHIGRVEGEIVRQIEDGFAMTISATLRKRDKLAAQLTWLANRAVLGLPEDRRHERIVPRQQRTTMTVADGREYVVRLVDISLSGAAVLTDNKVPLGEAITIGRLPAKVVRHFENGIALEFLSPLPPELFNENIVL